MFERLWATTKIDGLLNAYRAALKPVNREGLIIEVRKRKGRASG